MNKFMKNKKLVAAVVLTCILVMSMTVTAFAAGDGAWNNCSNGRTGRAGKKCFHLAQECAGFSGTALQRRYYAGYGGKTPLAFAVSDVPSDFR